MRTRRIGKLEVSAVGLGAKGFRHGYSPGVNDHEAIDLMRNAFDLGCPFFDTAEGYRSGANEVLVGRALALVRDQVVIATKIHIGGVMTARLTKLRACETHGRLRPARAMEGVSNA